MAVPASTVLKDRDGSLPMARCNAPASVWPFANRARMPNEPSLPTPAARTKLPPALSYSKYCRKRFSSKSSHQTQSARGVAHSLTTLALVIEAVPIVPSPGGVTARVATDRSFSPAHTTAKNKPMPTALSRVNALAPEFRLRSPARGGGPDRVVGRLREQDVHHECALP